MNGEQKDFAVLGIGNALMDVINMLESDEVLVEFCLVRGSMTLVDTELSRKIYEATRYNKREMTTGGSAANTIYTLASMGVACGYLGKTGEDKLGSLFREAFEKKKIQVHLVRSEKDTGRVMSLVSRDSERTMATYLGASADLKPEELTEEVFCNYSLLYIEGYLVQDHSLIETAVDLARKEGLRVAIDLSSFNVVEANLAFLQNLIAEKVDIVFANEEEAMAYTGKEPLEAVSDIAAQCEIAIVKIGKAGSIIQQGQERVSVAPVKAHPVDTTGAGDSYAAGFFYGMARGYDLEKCGRIAALVSGKVVEVMGAKLPEDAWAGLMQEVERIVQNRP